MFEWISVGERLPDEDQYVVFAAFYSWPGHTEYDAVAAGQFWNGEFHLNMDGLEARSYDGGACITLEMAPTHWAPLPNPPKLG